MSIFKEVFEKLKPASFRWKNNKKKSFGFIAQDLLEIFPEEEYDVVIRKPDGYLAVNYYQIIPFLVSKIRELEGRISELEEKKDAKL